jgi:hypothetical protein
MHLQELSASIELDSFCTTLFLRCCATWPGTGEWFQQAALHPLQNEVRTTKWCRVFQVFQSFSKPALCKQSGICIQAVKKPGRRLLSGTQEKLEVHNLFGIRKFF